MNAARTRIVLLAVPLAALLACSSSSGGTAAPAPELVQIDLSATATSLPKGAVVQLTATGTYSDDATRDLTTDVAWTSLEPTVVEVSGAPGAEGLATAIATGTATVRAETPGGLAATIELTVTPEVLASIEIAAPATLPLGASGSLLATGTFTDGSQHAIAHAVTWTSDSPAVLEVSNTAGTQGVATALALGSAVVTAESGGIVSPPVTVTVTEAVPELLTIAPVDPTIGLHTMLQLAATTISSDDSEADVTGEVTWTSSDPLVASVTETGTVSGLLTGITVITAQHPASGLEATITVEVTVDMTLSYLSMSKGSVVGGATVTGTVVLTLPAATDLIIDLASSAPEASVPTTVVIPAGTDRATFEVTTTTPARRKAKVVISATYAGSTKYAKLNVRR